MSMVVPIVSAVPIVCVPIVSVEVSVVPKVSVVPMVSVVYGAYIEPIKRCNCTKFKLLMIFMLWSGCCNLLLGNKTKPQCLSMHWLHKNI